MIPTNYTEAVNSVDSNTWILAMREFDSLVENTFEWQKAPRYKNCGWFFTIKSKSDRSYEYKAHFVAKDYYRAVGLGIKLTHNFMQSPVDPCMYIQNVNNQISIILLWIE